MGGFFYICTMVKNINNELLESLHPGLKFILDSELSLGNKIAEVSTDWIPLFIILNFPFKKRYEVEGVEFEEINDPHYWKAQYDVLDLKQCLACRF